jgi:hypothetical protein
MLAGIITESQYKAKLEEEEVTGKVGKQYAAPGYEDEIKGNKKKIKRALEKKSWEEKFKKIIFELYKDASQGLIFTSKDPIDSDRAVFVDENGKYKYLLTGERNEGLIEVPYTTTYVLPKSKAVSPPNELDISNFNAIIHAVLNSGVGGVFPKYAVHFKNSDVEKFQFGGGGGNIIKIGYVGYVVDPSKFSTEGNPEFGTLHKLSNNLAWIPYDFKD